MHNVFISYHHENDQWYKEELIKFGRDFGVFLDKSVDTGEISESLSDQEIRTIIRDEYLRNSSVTILLVGTETKFRKHVDWELYSSMFDGVINKKSGILVINLPSVECEYIHSAHGIDEKRLIYPDLDINSWISIDQRSEMELLYPNMPARIVDNLVIPNSGISVVPWKRLSTENLRFLIDATFNVRTNCRYDLSRPMRRRND